MGASFSASPIVGDGRFYLPSTDGKTLVLAATGDFKVLATNSLPEGCRASPAVSGKAIYLRTLGHLYRIEK